MFKHFLVYEKEGWNYMNMSEIILFNLQTVEMIFMSFITEDVWQFMNIVEIQIFKTSMEIIFSFFTQDVWHFVNILGIKIFKT